MKKQRGIANGWLYLIGLIVLVGLALAAFDAWTDYTAKLFQDGRTSGVNETVAAYANRDNAALRVANDRIKTLEGEARARERADSKKNAEIAAQRAKDEADYEKQRIADAAAVAAGTLVLRDPQGTAATACTPAGNRSGAGATVAATGIGDAKTGAQLSGKVTTDLLALTAEADDVARQLAQAQARITQDLATCNPRRSP